MRQKVYVAKSDGSIKVGVSIDPKSRIKGLSCGNPSGISLHYETDFCDNAEQIETIIHSTLSISKLEGEWFCVDADYAASTVSETFDAVAINSGVEGDGNELALGFCSCVRIPDIKNGMYKVSSMMQEINEYRVTNSLGEKQLAAFFITDTARKAIAESCIARNVPVSMVKSSSRGKYGGTYLDKNVFEVFIRWASGSQTITIADMSENVGTCISKAIEKAI